MKAVLSWVGTVLLTLSVIVSVIYFAVTMPGFTMTVIAVLCVLFIVAVFSGTVPDNKRGTK